MSAPARQLEDRLARIERLLEELVRGSAGRGAELLSKREAARRLRIDRTTTLDQLLRAGRLRAVPGLSGRGVRIPSEEVDRVLREGLPPPATAAPAAPRRATGRARRAPAAAETARAIRSIPIPHLDDE